ncbi:MAG TPA: NAD(P)H-dependent oxidoreductase [Xanthomonadaceae bacterium]|nr:NAD(P)H-dependent oxidoreductase [Xanthomonadaceae bacterium]
MSESFRILGFAGSLRKGSYNRAALRTAVELAPEGIQIDTFDLDGFPGFNEDEEQRPPQVVTRFKQAIAGADALLIVTPEYNYSIPGVLKNAIDWASRPYGESAFEGKCAAIMGASIGNLGTSRAQYHLRQCAVFLNLQLLNRPEVMIGNAAERFDEAGRLTHDKTRRKIAELVEALVEFTHARSAGAEAKA